MRHAQKDECVKHKVAIKCFSGLLEKLGYGSGFSDGPKHLNPRNQIRIQNNFFKMSLQFLITYKRGKSCLVFVWAGSSRESDPDPVNIHPDP